MLSCRDWFRRFKNNDFKLEDKERSGAPKKFEGTELEVMLDEDRSQTLTELGKTLQVDESNVSKRLKVLGMIQKQGHWVQYELKLRDIERRFVACELLLQRQKRNSSLHRIVTSDEKRTHYDNPKSRKSWVIENRGAMHQHHPQNQITMVRSLFSVFGVISK